MPAVSYLGANCTGHDCFPPRPNVGGSSNVFVNDIPTHRQDDPWSSHTCGDNTHTGTLLSGSSSVYVNGKQMSRIGDPISCGSLVGQGSGNVFCGG